MKSNRCFLLGVCVIVFSIFNATPTWATTQTSISGEIVWGELSMSDPNDLSFSILLNGKEQHQPLEDIQMEITDYRGIENGWQLTLRSSNYNHYNQNYQLMIHNKPITDSNAIIYKNDKQILKKQLVLSTQVRILETAEAGSYDANLEWTLQPNIKNSIKE